MADFLKNHWVFAIVGAILSAAVAWVYERTLTSDPIQLKKTFFKTMVATLISILALTWWVNRPEPTLTEPF